ncbi:hypothetical protein [Amycolatopsis sp. RTGN1]|uniref:hypothetical protein n=1 Tax=Amycolatopsis ponsaeliensis TaxID=2992142 RepID=UPI00254D789D|nr:hypothetical protein [Amycolatopsis sp. RTGN1]
MPDKVAPSVVGWRRYLSVSRSVVASVRSRAPLGLASAKPWRLFQAANGDPFAEVEAALEQIDVAVWP